MYPLEEIQTRPNVPAELLEQVLPELQGYYAHCTATDRVIGDLVAHMKEGVLLENTILVFTSDHGKMMGSHGRLPFRKQLAWDESLHVPFLISYPGIEQKGGSVLQAPLTTPDILPTLLGLCGFTLRLELGSKSYPIGQLDNQLILVLLPPVFQFGLEVVFVYDVQVPQRGKSPA